MILAYIVDGEQSTHTFHTTTHPLISLDVAQVCLRCLGQFRSFFTLSFLLYLNVH